MTELKRLPSGYWHVRWTHEAWAQWPIGRQVEREDFFHPSWSYSVERTAECDRLTHPASEPPK